MKNLQLGLRLKDRGLDAVEHSNQTWVERMRSFAKNWCVVHEQVTADNVRRFALVSDWQPDSPNAYGAVFKGKHWQAVGWTRSTHAGNHGRQIRIWRYVA